MFWSEGEKEKENGLREELLSPSCAPASLSQPGQMLLALLQAAAASGPATSVWTTPPPEGGKWLDHPTRCLGAAAPAGLKVMRMTSRRGGSGCL